MPLFAPLTNPVRPYAWGSVTAIPALTGAAPTGGPQAELWLGAHPSAPSLLDDGHGPRPLDRLIAEAPEELLGAATVRRFGPRLPFLFKVLAAERALSLQVHPTRAQAEAGFAAEEALGIPPDAPERVYKDRDHKPELLCALGDFEALCGFRPTAATAALLDRLAVPALVEAGPRRCARGPPRRYCPPCSGSPSAAVRMPLAVLPCSRRSPPRWTASRRPAAPAPPPARPMPAPPGTTPVTRACSPRCC